jgi:hypothetical protein
VKFSVQKPSPSETTHPNNRDYNKFAFAFCTAETIFNAPIVCVDFCEPSVKVALVDGRKGERSKICQPELD